jgi:hypothetical protein
LCALVALVAALINAEGMSLMPLRLHAQSSELAGASTQASVDLPHASVLAVGVQQAPLQSLTARTLLLGELMSTPPVLADIAHEAGVAPSQLSGSTSYTQNIPEQILTPDLEERANQIIASRVPYQLNIQPDPNIPRLEIYAQAPTIPGAERLADAAAAGLRDFLRADAISHHADPASQVRVEQLGPARGGLLNGHAKVEIAGLTFVVVFALCAALLLLLARLRLGWTLAADQRRSGEGPSWRRSPAPASAGSSGSRPTLRLASYSLAAAGVAGGGAVLPGPSLPTIVIPRMKLPANGRQIGATGILDDWPYTTRVLPWMIAAFLFVLWLVPFDSIQLVTSLPVDLKFDRIVLPIIFVAWILGLAAGRRGAPRLRLSWVHAGVFLFAALACLSIVINAHYLNQTLQLDRGVKRLSLLIAYVTFFVMIASIVRRSEVPAFLRYTLVLAVLAAIGTIIEYRFSYNVFYDIAQKLLPGFQIAAAPGGVDDLGRRLVTGPAELPLEAVGMFTMALSIALVGIIDATRWRPRLAYGLAAALLFAACLTTERKSALLGPLAVILALAFFRRRQLLRLAPLGLVVLLVVKVLAPGAIGSVTGQLAPSQLGVTTVDDRVLRYDAIRPDVWLHLAFGQGFGTYSVRVLDNELLGRLIEGGVLGLSAYVLMLLGVVFVAAGPIRRREPLSETIGLVAAAAAVSVLVMSALFDLTGYPHDPYIFLSLAGLLAVAVKPQRVTERPRANSPPTVDQA